MGPEPQWCHGRRARIRLLGAFGQLGFGVLVRPSYELVKICSSRKLVIREEELWFCVGCVREDFAAVIGNSLGLTLVAIV